MTGISEATISRLAAGKQGKRSDPERLVRIVAALDDLEPLLDGSTGRKHDRRLDDPERLREARDVQNARDPYWPFASDRCFNEPPRSFYAVTRHPDDTDEAARLRHLVAPRVRAGLVRDIDSAGPRTNWFLGRLRLLRARRAIYELADAARCWAHTATRGAAV